MPAFEGSKLSAALRDATDVDVQYEEERLRVHGSDSSTKIGYRPVSVLGIPVPRPSLVAYVRVEDLGGKHWYVVDWLKGGTSGQETIVDSEENAKSLVLERLRAAAARRLL